MNVSHRVINNFLLKKITRIERISKSHEEMVKFRLKEISIEKPVDLKFRIKKINLYFSYTSENYSHINQSLKSAFQKTDTFNRLDDLTKNQKKINHRGWNHVGYIFPISIGRNIYPKDNVLLVENLPKHIDSISCRNYKILPSTSVLVFEISLNETFKTDLYQDFYSPSDVKISVKKYFKNPIISGGSSGEKFDRLLKGKTKSLEIWILKFLKINPISILSCSASVEIPLENISQTKNNKEIMKRNTPFFFSQSAPIYSSYCFHSEKHFFLLKNIEDIRLYTFETSEQREDIFSDQFAKSVWMLGIIDAYQKKLEDFLEKSLDKNKLRDIHKLKEDMLLCNSIEFEISRLFEEIKNFNFDKNLFLRLKSENLNNSINNEKYSYSYADSFKSKFSLSSVQLTEKVQHIKKYLEKEFDSVTTEVNFNLQKEMKRLTRMAILISMFSVVITGFNTNWDFVKKNAESFRELVVGVKTIK